MGIERAEGLSRDVAEKAVRDAKWADGIGVNYMKTMMGLLVLPFAVPAVAKIAVTVGLLACLKNSARRSGPERDATEQYPGIEQAV